MTAGEHVGRFIHIPLFVPPDLFSLNPQQGQAFAPFGLANLPESDGYRGVVVVIAGDIPFESCIIERGPFDVEFLGNHGVIRQGVKLSVSRDGWTHLLRLGVRNACSEE